MKRNQAYFISIFFFIVLGLSACTPTHMAFYEDKVVGMDISTKPDNGGARIVFGYERETATAVPKTRICYEANTTPSTASPDKVVDCSTSGAVEMVDAMSVLSNSHLQWTWFKGLVISEKFATGDAAQYLAEPQNAQSLGAMTKTNTTEQKSK